MSTQERRSLILVVDDVEETRCGIERLLVSGGYQVSTAAHEEDAVLKAALVIPDLILICLGLDTPQALLAARHIREGAGLDETTPVVAFCVVSLHEGAEVEAERNVYLTRPDNFDQLRSLLKQILRNRVRRD